MTSTLELPRPVKSARPVSTKAVLMAAIQEAIDRAPGDSAEVAKCRKRHPVLRVKYGESRNSLEDLHHRRWRAAAADTADQLEIDGAAKITFKAGQVSYTVWNTRETLEGFLSRVKRAFP
jgi:hypothetical protein